MSVSKLLQGGGANDFNIALTGPQSSVTLDKEYSVGAYTIASAGADTSFDMYAYNSAGTLVGYTNTPSLAVSGGFVKLVILGGTTGDLLSFTYKTTYNTSPDNDEVTAGPFITSMTTTSFPTTTSTAGITGGNFASGITGTFTSASTSTVYSATVTRNSVTSLTVQRPETLPTAYNPYFLKLSNPGVTDPTGSNVNRFTVNAGSGVPTWVTTSPLATFNKGVAYSVTLSATDADGAVTYSIISGSLPNGLTLNGTTGVISGTPTTETPATIGVRATDTGGNIADITLSLPNTIPSISNTTLQFLGATMPTLNITNDSGGSVTVTIAAGALPSGVSMSSSGVFSGTVSASGTGTITLTITDSGGQSSTTGAIATLFRTQAAGGTFTYNALPPFYFPTDIISNFPVGTATSFALPAGINSYRIIVGGAGGSSPGRSVGGTGGYVAADYTNLAHLNSPITVTVGAGGMSGGGNQGGGGGGWTGVKRSDNTHLLIAGAGGSAGGEEGSTPGTGGNGAGGNLSGTAGGNAASGAQGGAGGTTSSGGSGGYGNYNGTGGSGSAFQGGSAPGGDGNVEGGAPGGGNGGYGYGGGGGGGAGYYGGGGGGAQSNSSSGGGGGSGFYNTSYGTLVTATQGGGSAGGSTYGGTGGNGYVRLVVLS